MNKDKIIICLAIVIIMLLSLVIVEENKIEGLVEEYERMKIENMEGKNV